MSQDKEERQKFVAMAAAMAFPINLQKDQHHAVKNTLRQANELADAIFGINDGPSNGLPFTEHQLDSDTVIREPAKNG